MSRPADLEALDLAYELAIVYVVETAMQFGGRPDIDDWERIIPLQDAVSRLELALAASLLERGVSWQKMASARRLTRQSLNYRLSRATVQWRKDNVPPSAGVDSDPAFFLRQRYQRLREQVSNVARLQEGVEQALLGSVRTFLSRSLPTKE